MDHVAAGRLGGIARARNNSIEQRREWSRIGGLAGKNTTRQGRPHNKSIEELMAKAQPLRLMNPSSAIKTKTGKVSKSFRVLKKQFLEKQSQINKTP